MIGSRRLIAIGAIVLLVLIALRVAGELSSDDQRRPGRRPGRRTPTARYGVSAYATLLARSGHQVVRLRDRVRNLDLDPRLTVVLLWPDAITSADAAALRRFLRSGGRLVVADEQPGSWLGDVVPDPPHLGAGAARRHSPARAGARDERGAYPRSGRLRALRCSRLRGGGRGQRRRRLLAAVRHVGRGRAVLLADASPLVNSRLAQRDDAAFALALAGRGRPVAFVESVHGYGRASGWGALPARFRGGLALFGVAGAALVLSRGRRLGPAQPQGRALAPARSEYADGLAGALVRTGSTGEAIAPVVEEARRLLATSAGTGAEGIRAAALRAGLREDEARAIASGASDRTAAVAAARGLARINERRGEAMIEAFERVRAEVRRVVVGQDATVDLALVAAATGGHVLLEGPPGVAKTLAVNALSHALGLDFRRVQFTPDMLPSDVTGTMTLRGGELAFRPGRVFTNVLLADEINRTPPKTQAALLEAMQERQVTVDGESRPAAGAVPGRCDPEPDRVRGHLSAARGAARPLPLPHRRRLSRRGRVRSAILRLPHRGVRAPSLGAIERVASAGDLEAAGALIDATTVSDEVAGYLAAVVRADARAAVGRARREPARCRPPAGRLRARLPAWRACVRDARRRDRHGGAGARAPARAAARGRARARHLGGGGGRGDRGGRGAAVTPTPRAAALLAFCAAGAILAGWRVAVGARGGRPRRECDGCAARPPARPASSASIRR